jgi:hypothetical protein
MSHLVIYTVTLAVEDEGWDALMEDLDADSEVRAGLREAVKPYDADALVEVDGVQGFC